MEYGTVRIKLKELIEENGMSRTRLGQKAQMQSAQLNRYYDNSVTRLDIDVLARICTVMGCTISDLLEFVPPKK